jgi:hypothetical protein
MRTLSFKARMLLNKLGGIEKAIEYLEKHNSFSRIPGIGKGTDMQLQEYLNELRSFDTSKKSHHYVPKESVVNLNIISQYQLLKSKRSVRAINILNSLESQSDFESSLNCKTNFFNKYFFSPFDFISIRNSGEKTVNELYSLKDVLLRICDDLSSQLIEQNDVLDSSQQFESANELQQPTLIPSVIEEVTNCNIYQIWRILENTTSFDFIQSKIENSTSAAVEFLLILILRTKQCKFL